MREKRLIVRGRETLAHCWSRIHRDVESLDQDDIESLTHLIKIVSYYCDLQLISYSVVPRGFDVLVRAPKESKLSDDQILERTRVLYQHTPKKWEALNRVFQRHGSRSRRGADARGQHQENFHDISQAMRLIKLRFFWNHRRNHGNSKSLWANRYQHMLVEDRPEVISEVAARVDAVPQWEEVTPAASGYAFCSFGEATANKGAFRDAIKAFTGEKDWRRAKASHARMINSVAPHRRTWNMPRAYGNLPLAAMRRTIAKRLEKSPRPARERKTFEERLQDLRAFKKEHGHCSIPAADPQYSSLSKWFIRTRAKKRRGQLPESERKPLEDLGVSWENRRPGRPRKKKKAAPASRGARRNK